MNAELNRQLRNNVKAREQCVHDANQAFVDLLTAASLHNREERIAELDEAALNRAMRKLLDAKATMKKLLAEYAELCAEA